MYNDAIKNGLYAGAENLVETITNSNKLHPYHDFLCVINDKPYHNIFISISIAKSWKIFRKEFENYV